MPAGSDTRSSSDTESVTMRFVLLRHRAVEAPQPCLDVGDGDAQLDGRQRRGHRRVDVAHRQHQVGCAIEQHSLHALQDARRLHGLRTGADAQVDIWLRQVQVAEIDVRERMVVVLPGVNEQRPERRAPVHGADQGRQLDEVAAGIRRRRARRASSRHLLGTPAGGPPGKGRPAPARGVAVPSRGRPGRGGPGRRPRRPGRRPPAGEGAGETDAGAFPERAPGNRQERPRRRDALAGRVGVAVARRRGGCHHSGGELAVGIGQVVRRAPPGSARGPASRRRAPRRRRLGIRWGAPGGTGCASRR